MSLNLSNLVVEFLKQNQEKKFTSKEIADWVLMSFPVECNQKKLNSINLKSDSDLLKQISAEISSKSPTLQKKNIFIKSTEGRPRKYYYSEKSDEAEVASSEGNMPENSKDHSIKKLELNLYPKLTQFLWSEFGVFSKRIDEKRSSNKKGQNGNKWLYPDLVGMEDLSSHWVREVKECVNQYSDRRTKLWSFEVKKLINRSNVRECFFQAVSNSSWANFGYLVAEEISGSDTLKELRMLFAAHGIGLIQLDFENPTDSEILIPARENDEIDWDMVNRIADENSDFLEYIKLVKQFYQTGEAREADWDMNTI